MNWPGIFLWNGAGVENVFFFLLSNCYYIVIIITSTSTLTLTITITITININITITITITLWLLGYGMIMG